MSKQSAVSGTVHVEASNGRVVLRCRHTTLYFEPTDATNLANQILEACGKTQVLIPDGALCNQSERDVDNG